MMALKSSFIQRPQRRPLWKYKERFPLPGIHKVDYLTMTSIILSVKSQHHNQAKHLVIQCWHSIRCWSFLKFGSCWLHLGNQSERGITCDVPFMQNYLDLITVMPFFSGLPKCVTRGLQLVQNAAVRILTTTKTFYHITQRSAGKRAFVSRALFVVEQPTQTYKRSRVCGYF